MSNTNTDLMRKQLEETLEAGSLKALAQEVDNPMLLIDTSSSMHSTLRNGKRAIDMLREIVTSIKASGHVPMIAFGGPYDAEVRFVDDVPEPDGGTPLAEAINLAKEYGATRVVVISDGCPDSQPAARAAADKFGGRIDVAFVGDPGDMGETFLKDLARITGGTQFTGDLTQPKELTGKIIGLLEGEVEEPKAPIQGAGFTTVDDEDDVIDADEDDEDEDEDEDDDE